MKPHERITPLTWWLAVLAVPCACITADLSALDLAAESAGRTFEHFGVTDQSVVALDGDHASVLPSDAVWRLRGDPRGAAEAFCFVPEYDVVNAVANDPLDPQPVLRYALIRLRGTTWWPVNSLRQGIVVFVWLVDGQVTDVVPVAAHVPAGSSTGVIAAVCLPLSEATQRGAPAILLWKKDRFVPPRTWFGEATADRALADLFLAPGAEADASLRALRTADVQPPVRNPIKSPGVVSAPDRINRILKGDVDQEVPQWDELLPSLFDLAAEAGLTGAVTTMLDRGATLNTVEGHIPAAWRLAVKNGRGEVVDLLQRRFGPGDESQRTVLRRLALAAGHPDVAARLGGTEAETAVIAHRALLLGNETALRQLATAGAVAALGSPPPGLVAYNVRLGRTGVLRALLDAGLPAAGAFEDKPWLLIAAAAGQVETVRLLLERGAPHDARTAGEALTPLMGAVIGQSTACIDALLAAGADVNAKDAAGRTALHHAVELGQPALAAQLLERGKASQLPDAEGRSPLDVALSMQAPELVATLRQHGARLDLDRAGSGESIQHALAMDAVDVLQAAAADGWKTDTVFHGSWSATAVANLHGAARCSAWLAGVTPAGTTTKVDLERGDVAAALAAGAKPQDVRIGDSHRPAVAVKLTGVVALDGSFLFPRIVECSDARLAAAVLAAASEWRFRPATSGGRPVASRVTLQIPFGGADHRIFAGSDVTVLPRLTAAASGDASVDGIPVVAQMFAAGSGGRDPFTAAVDFGGINPRHTTGTWVAVSGVVETDGGLNDLQVLGSEGMTPAGGWARALGQWNFSPGQREGHSVRTRVTLLVRLAD